MEKRIEDLFRSPVIQIGAGTGGRTAMDLASEPGLKFTHLVDQVGGKILQTAQRVKNCLISIEALSLHVRGYGVIVGNNGGSFPRIFRAMRVRQKGVVCTLLLPNIHQ